MEAFACGEIGLDISYFYQLTPREFDNIAKGYRRKLDREERQSWEQTRSIMFTIAMPNLPKTKRNMKITEPEHKEYFQMSHLAKGIYIMEIRKGEKQTRIKFVIQ
jgi:hypothetical protein